MAPKIRGRKNQKGGKGKMAVILRHAAAAAALLAVAAVCADGASTFYSSDPNLGSARVVFQVTRNLPSPGLLTELVYCFEIRRRCLARNSRKRDDFYWFLGEESGSRDLNCPCSLRGWEFEGQGGSGRELPGTLFLRMQIRSQNWLGA